MDSWQVLWITMPEKGQREDKWMRLLMVEDDRELCDAVGYQLQEEGYTVDFCYSGADALFYAGQAAYDVIILDRMLPGTDGLSIVREIRKKGLTTPVIMVTAMDGITDRIDGLDGGADDYLVKPFDVMELSARIRALTRRPPRIEQTECLRYADLELVVGRRVLAAGEKSCSLSKRECDLMEYFIRNAGQSLPREILLAHVWGADNFVEDGNLDNYVHFLRRRLRAVGSAVQIKTIRSVGYRLEA